MFSFASQVLLISHQFHIPYVIWFLCNIFVTSTSLQRDNDYLQVIIVYIYFKYRNKPRNLVYVFGYKLKILEFNVLLKKLKIYYTMSQDVHAAYFP